MYLGRCLLCLVLLLPRASCNQCLNDLEVQNVAKEADADDNAISILQGLRRELKTLLEAAELAQSNLQIAIGKAKDAAGREAFDEHASDSSPQPSSFTDQIAHRIESAHAGQASLQPYYGLGRTISRRLPQWTDSFVFQAAIRVDAQLLASTVIRRSPQTAPRFVAMSDMSGKIYLFTPSGILAAEHDLGDPVTSLKSHQPRSNVTMLVAGLQTGQILLLEIKQSVITAYRSEEAATIEDIAVVKTLGGLACLALISKPARELPTLPVMLPSLRHFRYQAGSANEVGRDTDKSNAVRLLALIPSGSRHGLQYAAAHENGTLNVWRSDGTLRQQAVIQHPAVLLRHVGRQLFAIHSKGVATLKLSSKEGEALEPVHRVCQGLNEGHIIAATFQQSKGNLGRYFALDSEGQILTLGPQPLTSCRVVHTSEATLPVSDEVAFSALPDQLLVLTGDAIAAFNTSGAISRHGPKGTVAASVASLAAYAMGHQDVHEAGRPMLLTAAPDLVVFSLGSSTAGFFSAAQHTRSRPPVSPMFSWARPIVIVIVALVVVWHFGNKRQQGMGMPFASRSSELFRDQMISSRNRAYSSLRQPLLQDSRSQILGERTGNRQARGRPKPYMGGAPELDQQVAQDIDRVLLTRQEAGSAEPAVAGSREKARENVQLMEEIEQAIRRRKGASNDVKEVEEVPETLYA